jgi:regulator of nucleoside diphosphate kinase
MKQLISSGAPAQVRVDAAIAAALSAISPTQHRALVHRDVVRLVALDFILRVILAGAVHMSFVINVLQVDPDDLAAHVSCFRIPSYVIANREPLSHEMLSAPASVMRLLNTRDPVGFRKPTVERHTERVKLSSLTTGPMMDVCEYLREELDRAQVLPAEKLRPDIVSLGSQVEFRDEQTGRSQEIILVYPFDADITRRRVSVLTPVGAALLGLSVNQTISFHTRTGERRELTVLKVGRAI